MKETVTFEQLRKLMDHIDNLEKLDSNDWESIAEVCNDLEIPLEAIRDECK